MLVANVLVLVYLLYFAPSPPIKIYLPPMACFLVAALQIRHIEEAITTNVLPKYECNKLERN